MTAESFESMLTGGHPNSLGRTDEIVGLVVAEPKRLQELFDCYASVDQVVRLRTSNALKQISRIEPEWLVPHLDELIEQISQFDQASIQWTLANLFQTLTEWLTSGQKEAAIEIMKHNLTHHQDWIVLNTSMTTLTDWAMTDASLRSWLVPQLIGLGADKRGSVRRKAGKMMVLLADTYIK